LTRGIVCAPHHLASEAGAEALRDGGNAIDAAIAANAVLCVVYPHMTSIGGDLFALVWPAGEAAPVGLEGAGRSGSLAGIEAVRALGYEVMPERGALTITVPGTVAAWGRLLERFGTFGLARVLEPAARIARDGWVVTDNLAAALVANFDWLSAEAEAQRLLPPLRAGMLMRNPELGASLQEIGRTGFATFYRGDIGRAIVAAIERRGGFVTAEDMAAHRSEWVEPVAFSFGDLTVYEMPPPTQGLAAAGLIRRLELLAAADLRPGPALARAIYRIRDQVYGMRDRWISDPAFTSVPFQPFLDPHASLPGGEALPEGDTIYLCAADEHGNTVSLIQSVANSFGSGVIAEGTGIVLQNRGLYFSLHPGHVNRLEPRKKTMHTLIPALASRGDRCWAAFGSMGADGQPVIQAQVFVNLAAAGLHPQAAVAAPRVRVRPGGGELWVEADYPGASELVRSGIPAQLHPARSSAFGHAQALVWDGPAAWRGGADPRADGSVQTV
jgi:gamma-glutamyltranspeptidase / glutathione hydrolase